MIIANIYNHPLQWCSTVPQVPTSVLHTFYMHTRMQSQVARTRSDRVLHMHRTTRRAIRQTDRAEPLQPLVWSMATLGSPQSARSLKCAASYELTLNLSGCTLPTPSAKRGEATASLSDRFCELMHADHGAATTAAENREPGAVCGGKGVHYDLSS